MAQKNQNDNIRKTTVRTADSLAKEQGFDDAQTFINDVGSRMRSADPVTADSAQRLAGDFTMKLALLTLYQSIDADYNLQPYEWINKFETVKIEAGNSKQFVRNILTGIDDYNASEFVPNAPTYPQVDSHTIGLYSTNTTSNADKALQPWARKIKRPITIQQEEWMPYFLSGKLQEFISKITNMIEDAVFYGRYKIIQDIVTKLKTGQNSTGGNEGMYQIINNPAGVNNLLDVFTKVVFPNIQEMRFLSTKYNIGTIKSSGNADTNNSLNSTDPSDILILINNKTYTKLTTGVLSQVFNNKLLEISHWVPKENIIPVSKKITVGTSSQAISLSNDDLIGENEIMVISKKAIKGLLYVDTKESQAWANNLTLQIVAHLWAAYGVLPWEQGFVVKTNALTVMPSNPQGN